MISVLNGLETNYIGLSTDTKPTEGLFNGDSFYEMDTGSTYYYDQENSQWVTAD